MDDSAGVPETPDEDPCGDTETAVTGEHPPRDSPTTRLQEAHKQARIAAEDLDADSDAAQYARIAGTVIEWALDELGELDALDGDGLGTGDHITVEVGDQRVVVDPVGIRSLDDIRSPPTVGEDGGDR